MARINRPGGTGGSDDDEEEEKDRRQQQELFDPRVGDEEDDDPSHVENVAGEAKDKEPDPAPDTDDAPSHVEDVAGEAAEKEPDPAPDSEDSETSPEGLSPEEAAEEVVDQTQESGIEEEGVGDPRLQDQAEQLEQQVIAESEYADSADDVAIRQDGDRLVATLSRSAAVDVVASNIREFTEDATTHDPNRMFSGTERVPLGVDLDTDDVVLDVDDGTVEASFDEDTQEEIVRHEAASELPEYGPDDLEVEKTDDGYQPAPTEDAIRDSLRREFASERDDVDAEDVEVTEADGEYRVTTTDGDSDGGVTDVVDVDIDVDASQLLNPDRERSPVEAGVETSFDGFSPPSRDDLPDSPVDIDVHPERLVDDDPGGPVVEVDSDLTLEGVREASLFDAGAMSGGSAGGKATGDAAQETATQTQETAGETRDALEDTTLQDVRDASLFDAGAMSGGAAGGEATGEAAQDTRESSEGAVGETLDAVQDLTLEDVREASLFDAGAMSGGAAGGEATGDAGKETKDDATEFFEETTLEEVRDASLFDAGATSPGGGPDINTSRDDYSGDAVSDRAPDGNETAGEISDFLADIEDDLTSGEGVEAGPRGRPDEAAAVGAVATGTQARGGANPVGVLVRRSPVGAPSRGAARTGARILAGTGLLAGAAVAVDQARDSQDAETATATEVGLGEGTTATEVGLGDPVTDQELDVHGGTVEQAELRPEDAGAVAEMEIGRTIQEVSELDVSDGGGADSGAQTGGETGDSVVPGDYPLPGRDMPADPSKDHVPSEGEQPAAEASPVLEQPGETEGEEEEDEDLGVTDDDPFAISDSRLYDPTREFGEQPDVASDVDATDTGLGPSQEDIGEGVAGVGGALTPARGETVEENFELYLDEQLGRVEEAQEPQAVVDDSGLSGTREATDLLEDAQEATLQEDALADDLLTGERLFSDLPNVDGGELDVPPTLGERGRTDQRDRLDQKTTGDVTNALLEDVVGAPAEESVMEQDLFQSDTAAKNRVARETEYAAPQETAPEIEDAYASEYAAPTQHAFQNRPMTFKHSFPTEDRPRGGPEFDRDPGFFDREWRNPVVKPEELDERSGEILGGRRERRRLKLDAFDTTDVGMDFLDDLDF